MKKKFGNGNGSGMDRESIGNGSVWSRKLFAVLFCLLFVGVGNVWGADPQASFSFTASTAATALSVTAPASTSSGTSIDGHSITSSPITISFSAGTGSDPYFWQTSTSGTYQVRMYNGNSITISAASGYTIKAITATGSGTGGNTYWNEDDGVLNGSVSNASLTTKTFRCIKSTVQINTITVTYVSSCSNSVTINKGTGTNCTFTLSTSGSQPSCSGVSTTVTVSPTSGYGSPSVTESGASAAPGITGSSNTYTVAYGANTTGTSTINVSCSANNYTITLNTDLTPTSAGATSITATYNASTNLTSAITKPTKTGWTFGGYYTAKNGGGTQIIDASGNVIASVSGYTDASKNWKYVGDITLYAKWTCTVTWSVNKATNVYSTQTVTYNSSGCKVASVPDGSDLDLEDYCGDKFMGWTSDENYVHGTSNLFTNVAGSPNITGNVTFYAVFADYDE